MDTPIHQSALGSSNKGCGGWRHLQEQIKSVYFTNDGQVRSRRPEACLSRPSYLLSRNVSVSAGGGSSLWLAIGRDVEEVPDQNGVVVRTAYDLKLIKLEAEHAARVLLQEKIK